MGIKRILKTPNVAKPDYQILLLVYLSPRLQLHNQKSTGWDAERPDG